MKRLSVILLSTAALCALASATPAVAQQTIMDPEGPAPIAAEPLHIPSHRPGDGRDDGPFAALGANLAALFKAPPSDPADAAPPQAGCREVLDFNDAHARPTTVCGP
jgi:hypothetical protein